MRWRTAAVILTCLVLGFVTTVTVAWAGAWPEWRPQASNARRSKLAGAFWTGPDEPRVTAFIFTRFNQKDIVSQAAGLWSGVLTPEQIRNSYEFVQTIPIPGWAELADDSVASVSTSAYGWPFLCLSKTQRQRINPDTGIARHEWAGVITRGPTGAPAAPVPIRPIWPGLIANILLYALAWWLLSLAFTGAAKPLIRHRRRSRGQCAKCAYDLKGLDAGAKCPECGYEDRHPAKRSEPHGEATNG